ncbi:MAG: tRNA (adenosine(37)-N6)-threonylcarbamoyltransferase complex dimerization subunit type 1 TsaB [Candidatus Gracilibacteria bacterium]
MLSLAINTATSTSSFAIFDANLKLLVEKSWPAKNNEAEKLLPEISKALKKLKKNFTDISSVIAVRGPGSFTGLRVGITVANTIAHLNNAKLYAIDTFEYLWHARSEHGTEGAAISRSNSSLFPALLLYAGRGGVYVSFNHENASKATLVNLPDLNSYLKKNKVKSVFGDISEEQFLHVQEFMANRRTSTPPKSRNGSLKPKNQPKSLPGQTSNSFSIVMQAILKSKFLKPLALIEPIYIKKPY